MKLLLIEDNPISVRRIIDFAEDEKWECHCCGFEAAENILKTFEPDIVVLDWMYDAEEIHKGQELLESIWKYNFCPVIIYSAIAEAFELEPEYRKNPLLKKILKADEEDVIDILKQWQPLVPSIQSLRIDMNKALISSLEVVRLFYNQSDDRVFKYMAAKRAAHHFNNQLWNMDRLPAWVQYIYPPMSESLFSGDIIRRISLDANLSVPGDCSEYRVILSPSCDMENNDEISIITAECESKHRFSNGEYFTDAEMKGNNDKKKNERISRLTKMLNQGYNNAFVSLPELDGVLPYLTLNLKKISSTILKSKIAPSFETVDQEKHDYYRVASVDSPFREQLIWAHMLNSCRPGVPSRDIEGWSEGVLQP